MDALIVAGWLLVLPPRLARAHEPGALRAIAGTVATFALVSTALVLWRVARRGPTPTRSRLLLRGALTFVALLILGWVFVAPVTYVLFFG